MEPISWLQNIISHETGKNELSLDFSDALFVKTNMNGLILECNSLFCSYFNITKTDVIGSNFFSQSYSGSLDKYRSQDLDWKCSPILGINNIVVGLEFQSSLDIKKDADLTASAEFRSIFESFPDLFLRVDQQGKILHFLCSPSNDFFSPEEQVIGTQIQDMFPLKISQGLFHAIFKAEKSKEICSIEFSNQGQSQLKYYEARVLPFFNKQTTINIREITANKIAEEALRNSEARLRSMWDTSNDGMALIDSKGNIISVNSACCKLFEITEEEAINKKSFNLLDYIDPNFNKNYEKRKIPRFQELKVKVKDDTKYIDLTNTFIESEGKNSSFLFTIFHDITVRVRDKKALLLKTIKLEIIKEVISSANESATLPELFYKVLQTVLQTLNFEGGGIYFTRKGEEVAELIHSSRLSSSLTKSLKEINISQSPFNVVFEKGENYLCKDYSNINPDFAEKFKIKTMFLVPIKIKDNTIGALYLKSEKIQSFTDDENLLLLSIGKALGSAINRIKTNDLLRKSEQKFRSVWENSNEPMRLTNCKGTVITVNKAFCDLFEIDRKKIIGEKYSEVFNKDFEMVNSRKNVLKILNAPHSLREVKVVTRSGKQCVLEVLYSSIVGSDEDLLLLTTFHDLTEHIRTEEELRISQKLAAVGKMAAYLSHEIKTPLTTIKLNFDLMKDSLTSSGIQNNSFNIVQKEINRLEKLLKDVLNYSRESDYNFELLYVPSLISNIIEFINPVLKEKNILLNLRIEDHFIKGDPQKLHSMFLHLIENSIDAIGENGTLEIYSTKDNLTNQYTMYIKDSGCGIKNVERLFDPFFSSKKSGTGLGLAIAQNIIKRHNGSITLISSSPGETIFAINFPGNN